MLINKDGNLVNIENNEGRTAIELVIFYGNEVMRKYFSSFEFLKKQTKFPRGSKPQHWASGGGNGQCLLKLIEEYGIDVNLKDEKGWTKLHFAVYYECYDNNRNKEAIELLLEKRANANSEAEHRYPWGMWTGEYLTPLGFAREKEHKITFLQLYKVTKKRTEKDIQYYQENK